MAIKLTSYECDELCFGYTWEVTDEENLARHIAQVALGQSRHVGQILANIIPKHITTSKAASIGAIDMLTVSDGADPWHRDGWMFQVMSWIAAKKAAPDAIISSPHMILAHKGLDGLQLEVDQAKGKIIAAIIFEDKATDQPRDMILRKVWPEFLSFESGGRENFLTAELTSLLEKAHGIDIDSAIENILWKQIRRYRVSITVGDTHADDLGRKKLFKGYDNTTKVSPNQRRGETIYIPQLREWMQTLSEKVVLIIRKIEADGQNNV